MPRSPERAQRLVNYVRREIERYKRGEIESVPSIHQIGEGFGYSKGSGAYKSLKKAGLLEERQLIPKEKKDTQEKELITPSREWAWMIGVLAGGGHIIGRTISLENSRHKDFLEEFKSIGERLFGINGTHKTKETKEGEEEIVEVRFNSSHIASQLGDLRRSKWPNTIKEKHGWILNDERYIWGFLEGVYEKTGNVYTSHKKRKTSGKRIDFSTRHVMIANFLTNLLVRVGIKNPEPIFNNNSKEGINGIKIRNISDLKTIADHIHSRIQEKERRLEECRQLKPEGEGGAERTKVIDKRKVSKSRLSEDEFRAQFINDYRRAREICLKKKGSLPQASDILILRREGIVNYTYQTFAKYFGNGSFPRARENLERIIAERGKGSQSQDQPQDINHSGGEFQIFP